MKRWLLIMAIAAQVAVLGFMAGQREWILRRGATLTLRTAPVDPRDAMRGEYIRFNYEIARVPRGGCRDGVKAWFSEPRRWRTVRDRVVYATLQKDEIGIAELVSVSDERPASGPFLRARVSSIDEAGLNLRFGVEARFTQQGAAAKYEAAQRDRPGVPVDVEVAVDGRGTAVLKSHRFEPLGIVVEVDRPPASEEPAAVAMRRVRRDGIRGLTVTLKNHGDQPLALVIAPGGGSFRLVPNRRWGDSHVEWAGADEGTVKFDPGVVHVLAPGASYREHLDLTTPRWFVRDARSTNTAPRPLHELAETSGASFRLEYAPPSKAECSGLPNAPLIRHGRLQSRAFGILGGGD